MDGGDLSSVESVLNCFVAARKCVQFYPPRNPRVNDLLENLVESLGRYFAGNAGRSSEQGDEAEPQGLVFGVNRDGFEIDGKEVGSRNEAAGRLASRFYRLGIRLLGFAPGTTVEECRAFLTALNEPAEAIREKGGVSVVVGELELAHIVIEKTALLRVVKEGDKPADFDMLEYLRRKQASRLEEGPKDKDGVAGGEGYSDLDAAVSDLADFFLELAEGSAEMRKRLLNTLGDTDKLSATLAFISKTRKQFSQRRDEGVSLDAMRRMLRHIGASLASLPEEARNRYLERMADAVTKSTAETQEWLKNDTLPAGVGTGDIEDELLSLLPDDTVADVLCNHALYHNGTANTITNFIEEFSDDENRRAAVKRTLVNRLAGADNERLRTIAEVLTRHAEVSAPEPEAEKDQRNRLHEERDALVRDLAIEPAELEALSKSVATGCDDSEQEHMAELLLYLQAEHDADFDNDAARQVVRTGLASALSGRKYESALRILAFAVKERNKPSTNGRRKAAEALLAFAAERAHLDPMLETLRGLERGSQEFKSISGILHVLGEFGIEALFDRLVDERNRSFRLMIAGLLAELGDEVVSFLDAKLAGADESVLRDLIYILGKTGSPRAVEVLKQAKDHSSRSVRMEVVKALGTIRERPAQDMLMGYLDDEDAKVAERATEWLRNMRAECAVPAFLEMLKTQRRRLVNSPELAQEVVRTLGELGRKSDLPALRKFRPPAWMFYSRKAKHLSALCKDAMEAISKRCGSGG